MRRIKRYRQVRNVNGCAACGGKFTEDRPSQQFRTLSGTEIAVNPDCIADLKFAQGVLRTDWQALREQRRASVDRGPHSDEDILSRVFAQNHDVQQACDESAERRIAAFLRKSKTALQPIETKQDIGAFLGNRMFLPLAAPDGENRRKQTNMSEVES